MDDPRLRDQLLLGLGIVGLGRSSRPGTPRRTAPGRRSRRTRCTSRARCSRCPGRAPGGSPCSPTGAALVDRRVRALRLARAAVDALLGDHRGHGARTLQRADAMTTCAQRVRRTPAAGACDARDLVRDAAASAERPAHRMAGSATTIGRPRSPPRARRARGMRASSGTSKWAASARAARAEDGILGAAVRADVAAHVLDHAEHRRAHLARTSRCRGRRRAARRPAAW